MVHSGDEQIKKGGRSSFVTNKGVIYRKFKSDSHGEYSQFVVPKKYCDTVWYSVETCQWNSIIWTFIYKESTW